MKIPKVRKMLLFQWRYSFFFTKIEYQYKDLIEEHTSNKKISYMPFIRTKKHDDNNIPRDKYDYLMRLYLISKIFLLNNPKKP